MPRYFTLEEARQFLPAVGSAIREGMEARKILEVAESDHQSLIERIMMNGGMTIDRDAASDTQERRRTSAAKLKQMFARFEEIGCVIKDLEIGLIDFPALYRGKEVYLCWRLGEDDIAFWHPTDEGFSGRRPIDREFLREYGK